MWPTDTLGGRFSEMPPAKRIIVNFKVLEKQQSLRENRRVKAPDKKEEFVIPNQHPAAQLDAGIAAKRRASDAKRAAMLARIAANRERAAANK